MGFFECCHYCVAPKRYPGCHSTCPDYIKQKAEWDALKEARRKANSGEFPLTYAHKVSIYKKRHRR